MNARPFVALAFFAALETSAGAQSVPIGKPPNPSANATSQLVWSAMSAAARAAVTNPTGAQAANLEAGTAIERYRMHDLAGARAAAMQALIDANQPTPPALRVLRPIAPPSAYRGPAPTSPYLQTGPSSPYVQTAPPPVNLSSIAEVDADGFIAQARGSLQACREEHSPNTNAASAQLVAAAHDYQAQRFTNAQAEAKRTIDLCAPSLRAINLRTP